VLRLKWTFPLIVVIATFGLLISCSKKSTGPEGPTRPAPPSELTGVGVDTTAILLTWHDNSNNEDGFHLYSYDGVAWNLIASTQSDSAHYLATGLFPGAEYTYRVTAFNSLGDSDHSNSLTIRTAPPAPQHVVLHSVALDQITITWTDVSVDELGFTIQRRPEAGTFQTIATTEPNDTSYDDTGLTSGTLYYYRVGTIGQTDTFWSEEDSVSTWPHAVPAAPSDLSLQLVSGSGILLSWTNNSSYVSYIRIDRDVNGGQPAMLDSIAADRTSYVDVDIEEYHRYEYQVYAVNEIGPSEGSNRAALYYGPSSQGAIPLARDNSWKYDVQELGGQNYLLNVLVLRVDFSGSVPWFLIKETNTTTGEVDTTNHLRNEAQQGVMRFEHSPLDVHLLWKYPAFAGDYYIVDGDCVLVSTVTGAIQVPAGTFENCYGYRRFLDDGTIAETFIKPQTGIVRVRVYSGATVIYEQTLSQYSLIGP
jgi:fibronectin type 3 domain-containing protein